MDQKDLYFAANQAANKITSWF